MEAASLSYFPFLLSETTLCYASTQYLNFPDQTGNQIRNAISFSNNSLNRITPCTHGREQLIEIVVRQQSLCACRFNQNLIMAWPVYRHRQSPLIVGYDFQTSLFPATETAIHRNSLGVTHLG